jgi:hypothetical protein
MGSPGPSRAKGGLAVSIVTRATARLAFICTIVLLASSAASGLAPQPDPGNISLDPIARFVINDIANDAVLGMVGQDIPFLHPALHYNDDATFTISNDPDVGPPEDLFTTPFVADPSLVDNTPADASDVDYTLTDGVSAWRVQASVLLGEDGLALDVVVVLGETGALPSPIGPHAVEVCVVEVATLPGAVPQQLGCVMDADGDGFFTHQEVLAGSDPTDPSSVPDGGLLTDYADAVPGFVCARLAASEPQGLPLPPFACPLEAL